MTGPIDDINPTGHRTASQGLFTRGSSATTAAQATLNAVTAPPGSTSPQGAQVASLIAGINPAIQPAITKITTGQQQTHQATLAGTQLIENGDQRNAGKFQDGVTPEGTPTAPGNPLDPKSIEAEARARAAEATGEGDPTTQAAQVAAQVGAGVLQAGTQGLQQVGQQFQQVSQQIGQAGSQLLSGASEQLTNSDLLGTDDDATDPGLGAGIDPGAGAGIDPGIGAGGGGGGGGGGGIPDTSADTGATTSPAGVAPVGSTALPTNNSGTRGGNNVVAAATPMPMGTPMGGVPPAAGAGAGANNGVKRGTEIEETKPIYEGALPVVDQQIGALPIIEASPSRSAGDDSAPPFPTSTAK